MQNFVIPAWVVVTMLLLNVAILAVWYHRSRAWTALALLLPMIYMTVIYSVIDSMEVSHIQLYGRGGFVVLLFCQAVVFAQLARLFPGNRNGS